ncbi:hypothetical protein C2G38_221137 [Gigaspora rosea]|uniref:Uncharacterized protein n=1 Tax=Gigaspora rosea TaxID=44941 RepID=A0A397W6V0_9GLOM|nr:hypothetical protein C2G38_221137 [Gigaspora rosea]
MKHRGLVIILIILIATDYEYLTILKDLLMFTKLNDYKPFNIFNVLENFLDVVIMWGAFFDIFFRNIPQIIIQVSKIFGFILFRRQSLHRHNILPTNTHRQFILPTVCFTEGHFTDKFFFKKHPNFSPNST